jgi:hypothetical protein
MTCQRAWWRWPLMPAVASASTSASTCPGGPAARAGAGRAAGGTAPRAAQRTSRSATLLRQAFHQAQAEADGRLRSAAAGTQQFVIPVAVVHVHGQHREAVAARVLDQLRGRVKAHRLAVQQSHVERRRVMALQPGGDVGEQGEARRVRLGKAVATEALDLVEQAPGVILAVAARQHALGELLFKGQQLAVASPVGDGAAQLVRLAAGKARRHHGQADHLLLEDRHAEGAFEHGFHGVVGVGDRLQALPSPQVGMHHVALDRSRAHDGDLDYQVVEAGGFQARQHGHLRPRLDLEHADRVRLLQHAVGGGVLGGDVLQALMRGS